jgi:hypothetical protein
MPEEMTILRIGTLIESNHGYVLEFKPGVLPNTSVVLCFLSHNKIHPFVIHTYMEEYGATHTGQYCETITEAQEQYRMRVS